MVRADLNGKTGKLLHFVEANERWGVRVDTTSECVKVKSANFTYHAEIKLKLPSDGSTRTRDLVEEVRGNVGTRYVPSQISLWREGVRLEVDAFDAAGVVYSTRLRDHGLGPEDDLRDPSSRTLEKSIRRGGPGARVDHTRCSTPIPHAHIHPLRNTCIP